MKRFICVTLFVLVFVSCMSEEKDSDGEGIVDDYDYVSDLDNPENKGGTEDSKDDGTGASEDGEKKDDEGVKDSGNSDDDQENPVNDADLTDDSSKPDDGQGGNVETPDEEIEYEDYDSELTSDDEVVVKSGFRNVSTKNVHTCAIHNDKTLYCWGSNGSGEIGNDGANTEKANIDGVKTPTKIGEKEWVHVSAGRDFTCGIKEGGALYCWGRNSWGELGNGESGNENSKKVPVVIAEDLKWKYVATGIDHACGMTEEGKIYCWGANDTAKIGNNQIGVSNNITTPVLVSEKTDWIRLIAGPETTCAINEERFAFCWGRMYDKWETFRDYYKVPTQFTGAKWWDLALGKNHFCGIKIDGTLYCWGNNSSDRLGLGPDAPVVVGKITRVGTDSDWREVSAWDRHVCAIKADHTLYCWGNNDFGQLGMGVPNYDGQKNVPTKVNEDTDWAHVNVADFHTCALKLDGTVYCWGNNDFSFQLGLDSDIEQKTTPFAIAFPE